MLIYQYLKEKEIELSDDEKELNRNLLSKYLTYKIESNYDGGGIKLLFFLIIVLMLQNI